MSQFLSVKAVGEVQEKSVAEKEQELLDKAQKDSVSKDTPSENDPPAPPAPEPEEIDEQKVLSYIGKRYNKQINSIDDLVAERQQAEELPEDVSAFLKYKKETGRGIDDFIKLNRDYDSIDPDTLVRDYLKSTQEGLDEEDIDVMMSDYEYDEDFDDESVVNKKKIERKKVINEAKKYFNAQKEQYKVPLESRPATMSEDERKEYEAYREYIGKAKTYEEESRRKADWFTRKTEELFSSEFKGFEFDINGKKISFTPGDAAELKKLQSNPQNFITKFLDEQGLLKDAVGYHKSLAIAMNPEKFAKHFYEQGLADGVGNYDKKIKNINMTVNRASEAASAKEGVQVRAVNPDSGKGLKIRSAKKV